MIGESLVGGVQGGVDTGDNSCMQLLQQTQTDAMVDLDFLPTQAGVATIQVILPTQDIVPPHIELEVQQDNSEEDLSLSQLISESILQPTPVMTHSMEDIIFIQRDLLEEVRQLRRVQEQLLLVERERLLLAKAKFELKKEEY
ncbi:unnamed protein product [Arctogadus glacialis]